ncbi:MAG TPA: DUF1080 domain-containing protein [Phycisphaerae bacterium]|nr:DUF1080 domain-containing protein [Phycisphaerae bacterium]
MQPNAMVLMVAGLVAAVLWAAPCYAGGRDDEADDGIMGEYVGKWRPADGDAVDAEAKVIGEGDGNFRAVILNAKDPSTRLGEVKGKAGGKRVELVGNLGGATAKATIEGGEIMVAKSSAGEFEGKYTLRKSPTEGAKPPAGAIVLLPYEKGRKTQLDEWQNAKWEILDDGSVRVSGGNNQTKRNLGSGTLHLEFRCPYMPKDRGQGRGNSGVYLHSRYEVQVLDSFGLAPKDNECGGIYSVGSPKVCASLPPGRWQTYDVEFTSPEVADGKITKPAVLTVRHNGILIHENVKADHVTTAGVGGPVVAPAPLMLQDHGNAIRYRNIWFVEKKD